jgi:fructose-bisphosphate aldolase, class I
VFDVHTITTYARANGHALARYAALCQEHGIVPIVEPEVLCNGDQRPRSCAEATRLALGTVFEELEQAGVDLTGIVLKPNFVTPGLNAIRERPWQVTFSFGRALVSAALQIWGRGAVNIPAAQGALLGNCRSAADAAR